MIVNPSQKNCQLFFNSCFYNIRLTDTGSYSLNAQVQLLAVTLSTHKFSAGVSVVLPENICGLGTDVRCAQVKGSPATLRCQQCK
ncbi:hypothetical protein [Phormidium nigroviride]|uniref:hypothetical protein n=1 Tax=Phormidium nigroviride TaxID=482564 RepID=UPI0002FA36CD|nr:hypothetical protein [Oscillatoria nigro-viridis]